MTDVDTIRQQLREQVNASEPTTENATLSVEDVRRQLRESQHHAIGNDTYQEDIQRERTARMEELMRLSEERKWDSEDTMMAARVFTDGLWLNKAEEAGSWIAAVAYKTLNPSHERSISEIRETMLGDLERESAAFRQERPKTALAANIAGGILSPASLAGGQLLASGRTLQQGAAASRSAPAILGATDEAAMASQQLARQMAAGGMQGRQALTPVQSAVLSGKEAIAAVAQRTPLWKQAAAVGGVEGAVFGFEGNTMAEKAENAAWSGALSAAFPMGFAALGTGWNALTKNRVAQELGEGDSFVNLMFTEGVGGSSGRADVYRHLVGKVFGAKGMIESQVNRLVGRIPKARANMEQTSQTLKNDAVSRMKNLRTIQGDNVTKVSEAAQELREAALVKAKAGNRIKEGDISEEWGRRIDEIGDTSKMTKMDLESTALLQADEAVNALNADFRANTLLRALPSEADEASNVVTSLGPQEALRALDEAWQKFGFSSAKKANYSINTDRVVKKIEDIGNKDLAIVSGLARNGGSVQQVMDVVAQTLNRNVKAGQIDGVPLIKLRSDIGTFIGDLSEGSTAVRGMADQIQDYLDDIIVRQLPEEAAEAFKKEAALWTNKLTVQEATTVATGGKRLEQGAYTAEDWITATKQRSKGLAARGMGVQQKEAQEVAQLSRARDSAIKEHAGRRVVDESKRAATEVRAAKEAQREAKRAATEAYEAEKREINRAYWASKKDATAKRDYAFKREQLKSQWEQQTAGFDAQIKELSKRESELVKMTSSGGSRITIFEQAFATGVLGSLVGRVFGRSLDTVTTGIVGTAAGQALKPEVVQRALAGQTGVQRSLQATGQSIGRGAQAVQRSGAVPSMFGATFNQVINRDQ